MRSIYLYQCLYFEKYDVPYYIKVGKVEINATRRVKFCSSFLSNDVFHAYLSKILVLNRHRLPYIEKKSVDSGKICHCKTRPIPFLHECTQMHKLSDLLFVRNLSYIYFVIETVIFNW